MNRLEELRKEKGMSSRFSHFGENGLKMSKNELRG